MKRRTVLVLVLATILVGMFTGGAVLAVTLTGTPRDDTLIGTSSADTIRAKAGDDTVRGLRGEDILYGNNGADKIVGGYGKDKIYGGRGNDRLRSVDLISQVAAHRDVVDCGPGRDSAFVDFRDRVKDNCEVVSTANP